MLAKRNLGPNVNEYIETILGFDSILCRCLREIVKPKSEGINIYAFLPDDFDAVNIVKYNEGGVYKKAASYLPKYLLKRYSDTKGVIFLFDDIMSSPSDDYLMQEESTVFSIGPEVYHFCNSDAIGKESLEKLIWACGVSWHFVCVILKKQGKKIATKDITEAVLCRSIQDGFIELVIGAFDGEGYIHYSVVGQD